LKRASRDSDTKIGGARTAFPSTRKSAVDAAASPNAERRAWAVEVIVGAYWKPAYKYIRMKWGASNDEAKDLTQAFFATVIEKEFFKDYDSARASFRTYLRVCVDRFVANAKKSAAAIKRGGGAVHLPLDSDRIEAENGFEREWVRTLFSMAVEALQKECDESGKTVHFKLFERYDLDERPATYAQLADEFGVSTTDVTNYLSWTRRQLRRIVLAHLKQMTGSEREFQQESRVLLGMNSN
jgi:DNA-directed RNA polymerase specialized sigma24 family protein